MSVELLNVSLDGFACDSGTTGTLADGYGVNISGAGYASIRNGKITNMSRGICTGGDLARLDIDGVTILNCGGTYGIQIDGPTISIFPQQRGVVGTIRNCFIAGVSAAGASPAYGISVSSCTSLIIENNRFGYSVALDGIAEAYMDHAVYAGVYSGTAPYGGIICRNNTCNLLSGGYAYSIYPTTTSLNCVIENALGGTTTYSGGWEGVERYVQ